MDRSGPAAESSFASSRSASGIICDTAEEESGADESEISVVGLRVKKAGKKKKKAAAAGGVFPLSSSVFKSLGLPGPGVTHTTWKRLAKDGVKS